MTEVSKFTPGSRASRDCARVSPATPAAVTTELYVGSFFLASASASCKVKRSGAPGVGELGVAACFCLATASGCGAMALITKACPAQQPEAPAPQPEAVAKQKQAATPNSPTPGAPLRLTLQDARMSKE